MRIDRYMEVVGSGPKPGMEKEYNEWYHKHITDLYPFKKLLRVSRSKLYKPLGTPGPMYLTIYEFNAARDLVEFYADPLMTPAKKHFEEEAPKCLEMYWAGFYEPVETLEREK